MCLNQGTRRLDRSPLCFCWRFAASERSQLQITFSLSGCREHVLEDTKPESLSDATDLALPPEMPILIDFHALKDILGPPMYELEVIILIVLFTLVVF